MYRTSKTKMLTLATALGMVLTVHWSAMAYTGAIFTTKSDGTTVNQNIYDLRTDVYLNGGPQNLHSAGLPDGTYYFQVTDPSGATLLSTDDAVCRQLLVVSGVVAGATGPCPHPTGIFNPANGSIPVQLAPFDFTPNPGGEYKVWLIAQTTHTSIDPLDSKVLHFSNSDTKTDNFKVKETACPEPCPPPPPEVFSISGVKFYDVNLNGEQDPDEPGIRGWKIVLFGDASSNTTTDSHGEYGFPNLAAGTYGVCEIIPQDAPVWLPTTATSISPIDVGPDSIENNFGNVCLGAGGGLTLGFWSNRNGQALFGADDLALMVSLNLRNADGSNFNPTSYNGTPSTTAFRPWLLSANATNMAYMLSAQLAAMELNVLNNKVSGTSVVYAPGCGDPGLNNSFISISNLMAAANTQLGSNGLTTAANDPTNRAIQECLKNALDNANNNKNFVQTTPCDVNYSGSESSCAPQP